MVPERTADKGVNVKPNGTYNWITGLIMISLDCMEENL